MNTDTEWQYKHNEGGTANNSMNAILHVNMPMGQSVH